MSSLFHDDVVDIAAAGDHGQHLFVLVNDALDPSGAFLLQGICKGFLKLRQIGAAVALQAKAVCQLDKIGLAVGVGLAVTLAVKGGLPLAHHAQHRVVKDDRDDGQLVADGLSILLTGTGIYPLLAKWGGAGALVPITGFANSVAAPAIEYKKEGQVFGIGCKIFTIAGPVILYGIVTSWALGVVYWVWTLM